MNLTLLNILEHTQVRSHFQCIHCDNIKYHSYVGWVNYLSSLKIECEAAHIPPTLSLILPVNLRLDRNLVILIVLR